MLRLLTAALFAAAVLCNASIALADANSAAYYGPDKGTKEIFLSGELDSVSGGGNNATLGEIQPGIGYYFSKRTSIDASGVFLFENTSGSHTTISYIDTDLEEHFPGKSVVVPYVGVGATFVSANATGTGSTSTAVLSGMVGIDTYFRPNQGFFVQERVYKDGASTILESSFGLKFLFK